MVLIRFEKVTHRIKEVWLDLLAADGFDLSRSNHSAGQGGLALLRLVPGGRWSGARGPSARVAIKGRAPHPSDRALRERWTLVPADEKTRAVHL